MIHTQEINVFNDDKIKSDLKQIATQFNVTNGRIAAIISEKEIKDYLNGGTTMSSKLNAVVRTVDGTIEQISRVTVDQMGLNDRIDNLYVGGRNLLLNTSCSDTYSDAEKAKEIEKNAQPPTTVSNGPISCMPVNGNASGSAISNIMLKSMV